MRTRLCICSFVLLAVLSASCRRIDLEELSGNVRFRATLHEEEVLYCLPEMPSMLEIGIYDTLTHKRLTRFYMSVKSPFDIRLDPGVYDMIAFSLGAESTRINFTETFSLLTAETTVTGKTSGFDVIKVPDHVYFHVEKRLNIPFSASTDSIYVVPLHMRPVFDSYCLKMTGVKGLENARSITHYFSNQYEDVMLADSRREGTVFISFEGQPNVDEGIILTEFNTFGMHVDQPIILTTVLVAADGQQYIQNVDVSDQVFPEGGWPVHGAKNLIVVDFDVTLNPLGQGGFMPKTEEWNENTEHYELL